jgi:hypothetical protein
VQEVSDGSPKRSATPASEAPVPNTTHRLQQLRRCALRGARRFERGFTRRRARDEREQPRLSGRDPKADQIVIEAIGQ